MFTSETAAIFKRFNYFKLRMVKSEE